MRLTSSYREKLSTIGITMKNYRKFKKDLKQILIYDISGNEYQAYEFKWFYKNIKICFYKTKKGKIRIALVRGKKIVTDEMVYVTPLCDGMAIAMQVIGRNIYVIALDKTAGEVFKIGRRSAYRKEMRKKNKK